MPRWLRGIILFLAGLIGLVGLIYIVLTLYLQLNRDRIVAIVTEKAQDRIQGSLEVGGLGFTLFRHPGEISLDLKDVRIRDSQWSQHQVTLLEARSLGLVFHPLDLLGKRKEWRSLYVEGARVKLYSDSSGYSNLSALRRKKEGEDSSKKESATPLVFTFWIQNLDWSIVDLPKAKSFSGKFHQLKGQMDPQSWGWTLNLHLDLQIEDFAFNKAKGSFMEGERLLGDMEVHFHDQKKLLVLLNQQVRLGNDPIDISGVFRFRVPRDRFQLELESKHIAWERAAALVTKDIRRKLSSFSLRDPLPIQVQIDGRMKYLDTPKVDMQFQIQNNQLEVKELVVDSLWMEGSFTNYLRPGYGHSDANSQVRAKQVRASLMGVPFQSDSVIVSQLKDPQVFMHAKGDFPLVQLKELLPSHLFRLKGGQMAFDLSYQGPISLDRGRPVWKGFMRIKDGSLTYLPRRLRFEQVQAQIRMDGVDLFMDEVSANTGNSEIALKGRTRDLLTYFYRNPRRVGFVWEVSSPWIDLEDFQSFLAPRYHHSPFTMRRPRKGSFGDQMEQVLAKSIAHIQVEVDSLSYRQFASRQIRAKLSLGEKTIRIPNFEIQHAKGEIQASAELHERISGTEFLLEAAMKHVNVKPLFYGFENFGQKAIQSENLEGIFSAGVRLKGRFLVTGDLEPGSMDGQVDFELREGGLIDYEPLEKIGRFVFKNRNLEELRFKEISNRLDLRNGKIIIHPMWIQSTALNLKVYGEYGLRGGTDIHLEIPLRNPKKAEIRRRKGLRARDRNKGIVLYLRVQDDPDGSMRIGWDEERGEVKADTLWDP